MEQKHERTNMKDLITLVQKMHDVKSVVMNRYSKVGILNKESKDRYFHEIMMLRNLLVIMQDDDTFDFFWQSYVEDPAMDLSDLDV